MAAELRLYSTHVYAFVYERVKALCACMGKRVLDAQKGEWNVDGCCIRAYDAYAAYDAYVNRLRYK